MSRFQRRKFLIGASALLAAPYALGQPSGRRVRIGILDDGQEDAQAAAWQAFRDQLRQLGYVEGKDLVIETRFAQGVAARVNAQAAELVALKPDLIMTGGIQATQAAMMATSIIPIVFAGAGDPVKSGLVASLARPGGNVTGQSILTAQLASKRLELLLEVAPGAKRIAYLGQSTNQLHRETVLSLQETGQSRGVAVRLLEASSPDAITRAFETMVREKFGGFLVAGGPVVFAHRQNIVDLAARHRLPAVYGREEYVAAGGFLSYGRNVAAGYRADRVIE